MRGVALNYIDTFIQVAADCPVTIGVVPVAKGTSKPAQVIEYELLSENPYKYTQEDLIFEVYVRHKSVPSEDLKARGAEIRAELFQKPHPCLRASLLPKKYGWGVHFNTEGKIALYGMETEEYRNFIRSESLKLLTAFRNKRG